MPCTVREKLFDEYSLGILVAPSPTPPTRATDQGGDGSPVGAPPLWMIRA